MNTAGRLKEIMEERDLRQVDIVNLAQPYCDALNIKMNKSDISQYLSGKTKPNQDKLFVLSRALGVEIPWLMGYDVPRYREPREPKYYDDPEQTGFSIPILGKVAAGIPIEAVEDFRGEVTVSEDLFRKGHYAASIQHAIGVPDAYIMQRGGWGNDGTLKAVYRHTLEDKTAEMDRKTNDYFSDMVLTKVLTENEEADK